MRLSHQYPFDKIASPNLLNQGVFEYFLNQPFYHPILVIDILGVREY